MKSYPPLRTRRTLRSLKVVLCVLSVLSGGVFVSAQIDPRQMAGIPRPVNDLPDASISVRLIRGQLSNNIASHLVELHFANGRVIKRGQVITVDGTSGRVLLGAAKLVAPKGGEHYAKLKEKYDAGAAFAGLYAKCVLRH